MLISGIISFSSNGIVLMKIIAGCGGINAKKVGEEIMGLWPLNAEMAQLIADKFGFGCEQCLVVMTDSEILHDIAIINPLYREKFQDPEFNPFCENGASDHVVLIEI